MARAVVFEGPGKFSMRELPIPEISDGEMLLEVAMAGVDGSEVHMFKGELEWLNNLAPLIFGDEIVGRVGSIGAKARELRGLEIGDRVIVEARWPCYRCEPCLSGQYFICQNDPRVRTGYGSMNIDEEWPGLWGGYASHVYVPPEALVYKVPDAMSTKTALMSCSVLANGMRWTKFGGITLNSRVAVIGPGPQGLACVLSATHRGARVISVGLEEDSERLKMAGQLGAVETVALPRGEDPNVSKERIQKIVGQPIDVVIDAAGFAPAKQLALALVKPLGAVLSPAVPTPLVQPLNWMDMTMREITLYHPRSHAGFVGAALDFSDHLIRTRGLDVGDLVSHVFPLEQAEQAIRVASGETGERPVKVALDPSLRP
jgi:alcohol dehydrogenase